MSKFLKILNKTDRLVLGVLSGTSVDAVDIVLVKIIGKNENVNISILKYKEFRIPSELKNYILKVSNAKTGKVDDICRLNVLLGKYYADCINKFLKIYELKPENIDLIGSHGQTIHHLPSFHSFGKIKYKSTLQIGDPSVIANNTGIITVGDFRNADVAVDGGGAPLVPYLDYVTFRSEMINRIVLNIGGISNLTYLPAKCRFNDVIAFDTGPGNMMIDYLAKKYFNRDYDKDCKIAKKGKVNPKLLKDISLNDINLNAKPPKSTGRELYNNKFVENILKKNKGIKWEDIIRTFTAYTAFSISENIKRFLNNISEFELLVSGGGANSHLIMDDLINYLPMAKVKKLNHHGITASNKEAVLFALLAHETLNLNSTNLKSVTGANKNVILGKICLA